MATTPRSPPLSLSNLTYVNNTPGAFSPLPNANNANNGITSPTSPNIVENNSATNANGRFPRTLFMNKLNAAAVPEVSANSEDTDPIAPEENQAGGSRKRSVRKSKKAKSKKSKKTKSKKNVRRN